MRVYKRTPTGRTGAELDRGFVSIVSRKNNPQDKPEDVRLRSNNLFIDLSYSEYLRLKEWFDGPVPQTIDVDTQEVKDGEGSP